MKKEIIKSFDLEAYKNGAKIRTRDGHEARIICTDAKNPHFPIVALIKLVDCSEITQSYTSKGKTQLTKGTISDNDLVIVEEVEEPEFWSDKENYISGFYRTASSGISRVNDVPNNEHYYDVFATKKQVRSVIAMARISQIMANDIENFGGVITDEEWKELTVEKYAICRLNNAISLMCSYLDYRFLAFHTEAQRDLFLEKYRDLVQDYLMID
jgi:hypothetical protein